MVLDSYLGGRWQAGTGEGRAMFDAVTGEEVGRLSTEGLDLAGAATVPAGIEGQLATLTKAAMPAVGVGGAAVTLLGLIRGVPVREALASGVAVAVAAVPEGLPLVATVAQEGMIRVPPD